MKSNKKMRQHELEKPKFGSIYRTKGSRFLYVSFYYFNQRLRFPTDREDTPECREELTKFMNKVGERIRLGTFQFAKTFYWLDEQTKAHFTALEGREFKPEPEHVLFSEYAVKWMENKIPKFASVSRQRDYIDILNSRILPYFGSMPFASITATVVETFIDNLKRAVRAKNPSNASGPRTGTPLSGKRIKHIIVPLKKIWIAACNDHNWNLRYPFTGVTEKCQELADIALQEKEKRIASRGVEADEVSRREVFLLDEWQQLLACIDPHYHLVIDLLLSGLIGSELEALQKQHVCGEFIQIRCAVVRDKDGNSHYKFKPKNWYRKREIPITKRFRQLIDLSVAASNGAGMIEFANDITIPANQFVLTMLDGSPFNYRSFRKNVWDKAIKKAGIAGKVPYASRHTFVQWALLLGVTKTRLVDLMGHCNKGMIDRVYGKYRQGLVEDKEAILDYLGEDFLALEELKRTFPERYRKPMATGVKEPETTKAPALAATFGQSFGQSLGLYADNYMK